MLAFNEAALAGYLAAQRWFGGKGAAVARAAAVDRAPLTASVAFVVIEVSATGNRVERYAAALKAGKAGAIADGLDDAAARALLELLRSGGSLATVRGSLHGNVVDPLQLVKLGASPVARRLSAEQSNTSIVFDDSVILKLIRRIEFGLNPELEMGAFLARHGYRGTPALAGALMLEYPDRSAVIAVAHRFVSSAADAWGWLLQELRAGRSPTDDARALGRVIGELHATLAADDADPAFAPEPITQADLLRWADSLEREVERTLLAAGGSLAKLDALRPVLVERITALRASRPTGVRIRQHGDLHLGQILREGDQFLVFDFEGEPVRPLTERREKHSPYKDAAGMLRSFSYAVGAAGLPADHARPLRAAFLDGWRTALGPLDPGGPALLDALELEKLLYELRYELGHRPDWVHIPARDLLMEVR